MDVPAEVADLTDPDYDWQAADRTGYRLTVHGADDTNTQTYYVVNRDSDGAGLGAYARLEQVDRVIEGDRALFAPKSGADHEAEMAPEPPKGTDLPGERVRKEQEIAENDA